LLRSERSKLCRRLTHDELGGDDARGFVMWIGTQTRILCVSRLRRQG
jgi:hypothetical protein